MERNTTFATIVTTGEQPHAEIHGCAFDEGDGYAIQMKTGGNLRAQGALTATLVERMCKALCTEDSVMAAAAFIGMLGDSMMKGAGPKAMQIATMMNDPEFIAKAVAEMIEKESEEED